MGSKVNDQEFIYDSQDIQIRSEFVNSKHVHERQ